MAVYVRRQLVPDLLSDLLPKPTPRPTSPTTSAGLTTTSTSVTSSSSAITTSTTSSTSTVSSTSTSSVQTSSASSTLPTSTIVPTTSAIPTTSDDPSTQFVTSIMTPEPSPTASVVAAPANDSSGFLQNKTLTSVVFSIVGVIVLIIIVTIVTVAFRRSRRKRLLNEAVSFDPGHLGGISNVDSGEKRRFSLLSSHSGQGGMSSGGHYGGGYTSSATAGPAYPRHDMHRVAPFESQYNMNGHQQHWHTGHGAYAGS